MPKTATVCSACGQQIDEFEKRVHYGGGRVEHGSCPVAAKVVSTPEPWEIESTSTPLDDMLRVQALARTHSVPFGSPDEYAYEPDVEAISNSTVAEVDVDQPPETEVDIDSNYGEASQEEPEVTTPVHRPKRSHKKKKVS